MTVKRILGIEFFLTIISTGMWKGIKFIFFFISALFGIFFLQSGVNYFLPYPFNQINSAYIILTWFYIYKNKTEWLWVALGTSVLMEIYSSHPFGVMTAAILLSLILVQFMFNVIFTNFSWINVFFLGFLIFIVHKMILIGILFMTNLFNKQVIKIEALDFYVWIMEAIINAMIFLIVYAIAKILAPKKIYYGSF